MPVKFICRLLVVRTESGKLRVQYGYLGDDCVRMLTVHGPQMVIPPSGEMTDEEFSRWEFELVAGTGFYYSLSNTPISSALVEATRTYEEHITKGTVQAELAWVQNEGGERTLAVRVTNGWTRPVPRFSLSTECHYDAPQPEQIGSVQAHALGGSESMFHPMGPILGDDLWTRVTVGFYLDPAMMVPLRSRVAALSTESYWIALRTDGQEFDRIPGEVLGAFLEAGEEELDA